MYLCQSSVAGTLFERKKNKCIEAKCEYNQKFEYEKS